MKLAKEFRQLGVIIRKRVSLFKYNLMMKRQLGVYDPSKDYNMMEQQQRSLNLFDFGKGKLGDFHLIEDFSDASMFGGESLSEMALIEDEENPGMQTLRIEGRFVKERNDLLPIDYLFFGFRSLSLFQTEFTYFNGLRITMKPPSHPCKLGLYLATNYREYEHYTGHLLDLNNSNPSQYQAYEIPIQIMMNDKIRSKVVQPSFADDNFKTKGYTFSVESTHATRDGEPNLRFDIQKIDAIFNPEYDKIVQGYKHPVFFKSVPYGLTYADQGFLDNDQSLSQQEGKPAINEFAYQEQPQANFTKRQIIYIFNWMVFIDQPKKSIKERIG